MRGQAKGFYFDKKAGTWVVQATRMGPAGQKFRRCQRVRGTISEARARRKAMVAELDAEVARIRDREAEEQKRRAAVVLLGLTREPTKRGTTTSIGSAPQPTLQQFLLGRWAQHVLVTQNETTRRTTRSHVAYLSYYLGQQPLAEIDDAAVAVVREGLLRDGPRSFVLNRSGEPRKRRSETFTPTAVNRILATLAAALNLAERERLIERAPRVDLLPRDESEPVMAPSDDELAALIKAAEDFREIAPFMPEAIELAAETGMRAGEQFALSWRSVDFRMNDTGAIRIEKQPRAKLVGGTPWRPKHLKTRLIPLTPRARTLLESLRERVPSELDAPVIPSRGGSPYNRLEAAPDKSGKGFFPDVVEAAGLVGRVHWHSLRHYFAVRGLLRGVPIAVVSAWLGHSDVNLTVKRYGRWAAESREQWQWAKKMSAPIDAIAPRPALAVVDGGKEKRR